MLKKITKKVLRKNAGPLNDYHYNIDVVSENAISGWAKNIKLHEHQPVIDFYVNGSLVWQCKAENYREDLANENIGNFAFYLEPNAAVLNEDATNLDIYIDGHKVNIEPYVFELKAQDEVQELTHQDEVHLFEEDHKNDAVEDFICTVDAVTQSSISGWAKSKKNDSQRLLLEFRSGDNVLASGTADSLRKDLLDANIGDGKYSFSFDFNLANFQHSKVEATLYINGVAKLDESYTFQIDEVAFEQAKFQSTFGSEIKQFNLLIEQELNRMNEQIVNSGSQEINVAVNVVLQNVAELIARVKVMEKALIKVLDK